MVEPVTFPAELLIAIVGHLRDKRINFFDPVATRDLQNVRLVSRVMQAIATPMLFENMVYDLKLYRKKEVNKLVDFARINPELAKLVLRIQVRVPPVVVSTHAFDSLRESWTSPEDPLDSPQADRVYDGLVDEIMTWSHRGRVELNLSVTREISKMLPNLHHLENGISTLYEQELVSIRDKLSIASGIEMHPYYDVAILQRRRALEVGLRIVLSNVTDNSTALRLRDVPLWVFRKASIMPRNLLRLDLEVQTDNDRDWSFFLGPFAVSYYTPSASWRRHLQDMKQLRSLRLGLGKGGRRCTEYEEGKSNTFYIDDLLLNPNDAKEHCFFPELHSLELVDGTIRLNGLLAIIEKHQQTLKKLILHRITLIPSYSAQYWCNIADMCKDAVPGLTYLRLTKLVTFRPKCFNHYHRPNVNAGPTPTGWRSGLEGAMTYEWSKVGAGGTDYEFIGSKCPWIYDGEEDTLKDNVVSANPHKIARLEVGSGLILETRSEGSLEPGTPTPIMQEEIEITAVGQSLKKRIDSSEDIGKIL